jgi:uncharacterized membrane protein HdeD (DUF308 family)
LWAAWFVVGVLRLVVVTEHRPREGKLIQDLLAGLVYLAAFFAIISYVFDLPIKGLLATSGAIAIMRRLVVWHNHRIPCWCGARDNAGCARASASK